MKNRITYLGILIAALFLACSTPNMVYGQTQETQSGLETVKYTCPTHPDIVKDMPDKCPKCGMQLVEKVEMNLMPESPIMKNDLPEMMKDSAVKKMDPFLPDTTSTNHAPK